MIVPFPHLVPVYQMIDVTLATLAQKSFRTDPVLDARRSQETSVAASAVKRHGHILDFALQHSLGNSPHYEIWQEKKSAPEMELDFFAYDQRRGHLGAYEFKRGFGKHDAGKTKQIKLDLQSAADRLRSYGEARGLVVDEAEAKIIAYYGKCSIGAPWVLTGAELDAHFDWPVRQDLEAATKYFRARLAALFEPARPTVPDNCIELVGQLLEYLTECPEITAADFRAASDFVILWLSTERAKQ